MTDYEKILSIIEGKGHIGTRIEKYKNAFSIFASYDGMYTRDIVFFFDREGNLIKWG